MVGSILQDVLRSTKWGIVKFPVRLPNAYCRTHQVIARSYFGVI